MINLFEDLPVALPEEWTEVMLRSQHLRIERIVSTGQSTPDGTWYDQVEQEWVVVLAGAAVLLFQDGESLAMKPGDSVLIAAHRRHRVQWTSPDEPTLWLAVFFPADS